MRIFVVDDEQAALRSVTRILRRYGLRRVDSCDKGSEAIERIVKGGYDIVLLDLIMPEIDGLQILETVKPLTPSTEFIILPAMDDVSTAVKAIRFGAYDYLVKPVENERLHLTIQRAYERKGLLCSKPGTACFAERNDADGPFSHIITRDLRMKEVLSFARVMAQSGNPILVTGESGTGKELLARGIHAAGPNPEGPFVPVNVASIPATLFEGEFFGYSKGAFTGADRDFPGFFERANGGTLFLDEVGELPLTQQAKFLRVLEDKTVQRLGDARSQEVSFRVVSATNRDLHQDCRDGKFRLDLLYRLKSVHVHLPPLRERRDDIPLLASHFLEISCARHNKEVAGFAREAMDCLLAGGYEGNIRELAQTVERGVLLCDSQFILPQHLGQAPVSSPSLSVRTLCTFKENDETHLAYVLSLTRGNLKEAAKILGVTVRQIQRRVLQMRQDARWAPFMETCKD
jgi:DNA-binding NtrC family response regulator